MHLHLSASSTRNNGGQVRAGPIGPGLQEEFSCVMWRAEFGAVARLLRRLPSSSSAASAAMLGGGAAAAGNAGTAEDALRYLHRMAAESRALVDKDEEVRYARETLRLARTVLEGVEQQKELQYAMTGEKWSQAERVRRSAARVGLVPPPSFGEDAASSSSSTEASSSSSSS